jgi:hypothetical protein
MRFVLERKTAPVAQGRPGRWPAVLVVAALLAMVFAAAPVSAAPSGDIDATITVEGPCITLPTVPIAFGSVGFSQATSNNQDSALPVTVGLCASGQPQELYARASDATGDLTGAWALQYWDGVTLICDGGTDVFGAALALGSDPTTWLSSTADALLGTTLKTQTSTFAAPSVLMPCSGSTGVGETMTYTYTITAALP